MSYAVHGQVLMLLQFYFPYGAYLNPVALRKAKIVCNFGLSECNRVKSVGT